MLKQDFLQIMNRTYIAQVFSISIVVLIFCGSRAQANDRWQDSISSKEALELEQAKKLRIEDNPEQSISILSQLVTRNPDYYSAQVEIGLSYYRIGNVSQALEHMQKAKSLLEDSQKTESPIKNYAFYNSLGWIYLRNGDLALAIKTFCSALEYEDDLHPSTKTKIFNNRGLAYRATGKFELAKKDFEKAIGLGSVLARQNIAELRSLEEKKEETHRARIELYKEQMARLDSFTEDKKESRKAALSVLLAVDEDSELVVPLLLDRIGNADEVFSTNQGILNTLYLVDQLTAKGVISGSQTKSLVGKINDLEDWDRSVEGDRSPEAVQEFAKEIGGRIE